MRIRILFVVLCKQGHTFQLVWIPGQEERLVSAVEKWVDDDELEFSAEDGNEMLTSSMAAARSIL